MPFKIIGFSSLKSYFRQVKWKILALFPLIGIFKFLEENLTLYKNREAWWHSGMSSALGSGDQVQILAREIIYYDRKE